MRKISSFISLLLICLAFTSCVDYVQSVTFKNGKYHMYYKVTLSKLLFAMMDEDPEEIFRGFDEEALGEVPENASVSPVNTDLEVGAEFKFGIDPKTTDETEKDTKIQQPLRLAFHYKDRDRQMNTEFTNTKYHSYFMFLSKLN